MARQHGTRSCYMGGCRRDECVEAQRTYLHDYYTLRKQYATSIPNVNPARVAEHIQALRDSGMGVDSIARLARVRKNTIWYIARGQRIRGIRPATASRILAVTPQSTFVDSTGSMRRLQALAALGHTFEKAAAEIGIHHRSVSMIACGNRPNIHRSTADAITLLYDKWSMTAGPSSRVRGAALAKGWVPPLAWDDDTIDDPGAQPEGVRVGKGRGEYEFDIDEWFRLVRMGELPDVAAKRCGVQLVAVERRARRMGRAPEYVTAMERARERYAA